MRTLALTDGLVALFLSAASFAGATWVSLSVGLSLAGSPPPPAAPFLKNVMQPALGMLVGFFLVLAVIAWLVRHSTLTTIKRGSQSTMPRPEAEAPPATLPPLWKFWRWRGIVRR